MTLSAERREALVELARRHGLLVIEELAYRELRYDGEAPPTLLSLGPDVVLQAGTFSKTFFPGVRLGWAAGPAELVSKLVWAKQNTDQCAGALGQRLLEEYGRRGYLDEQISRARELYRSRRDTAMGALERHAGGRITWTRPQGGFFTWLELAEGRGVDVARRALEAGVAVVPAHPSSAATGASATSASRTARPPRNGSRRASPVWGRSWRPTDQTSSISWTSSAQSGSGSAWHAAARSSSQMAANAR